MNIVVRKPYLNKIISFDYQTGCIPAGSVCYCYSAIPNTDTYWVCFRDPVLGRNNIKLHQNVIIDHGRIIRINARRVGPNGPSQLST